MPICKNCGVEVESNYRTCPLCGAELGAATARSETARADPETVGLKEAAQHTAIEAHDEKVRLLFQEVFGFIALAAAVVVFATDFAYGMKITWSRIPLISIGYIWLSIFMIPRLKRIPYLLPVAELLTTALFLYALNLFTGGRNWFWELALPIVAALGILMLLTVFIIRVFKLSVLGGLAVSLISAGLFTLCLEAILNSFLHERIWVSWSLVTAASVIPIIAFLVSFEKRLKKRGSNLQKHFHV